MTIELSQQFESALHRKALVRGVPPDVYAREVLERDLSSAIQQADSTKKHTSMLGLWANMGISLSKEDIDANRADMLRGSIFDPDVK
jgi:hypothetical protein